MRDLPFSTTPIFFGVVLYLLTGCAALSSNNEKPNAENESLTQETLVKEINSVDKEISTGDPSADLFYQKGYLLGELAQKKKNPSERSLIYEDMNNTLASARDLFLESGLPSGTQKVDDLLKVRWSNEHNQGVLITQTDSALTNEQYDKATAHFNNATTILPDTSISYRLKAQTHYKHNDVAEAISTLENARTHISQLPSKMLEQLAFMYLETGKNKDAVAIYEEAKAKTEDSLNLIHGLSNAYIKMGSHKKAVELLNLLIENEPENIMYRQTLGNELYFLAADIFKSITEDLDSVSISNNLSEIDSLLKTAEANYQKAYNENPDEESLSKSIVSFYQNTASKYQRILPLLDKKTAASVKEKIQIYLQQSIPIYQELLAKNPNNEGLRNNLFLTYSYLGMKTEAEELQ